MIIPEHSLESLLGYDGRTHFLASGHFVKFEVKQVDQSERTPHGLSYSFTLHDPDGTRILGFDNAHPVAHKGSKYVKRPSASDHWHRTRDDVGRPYSFVSTEKLLEDFFTEVERVLNELGVLFDVVEDKEN
nr:DUF6516 family protein [Herbaspirillum sp. ASV7]